MFPHERSLVENLSGKPFALLGVNGGDDLETVKKLVDEGTVTWRSFKDETEDGNISDAWGVEGWPTVYLIDAEGVIRYKNPQRHRFGEQKLDEALSELLEEVGVEYPASHDHEEDDGDLKAPGSNG